MDEAHPPRKTPWAGILIGAVALAAVLGAAFVWVKARRDDPPLCDTCRRPVMSETAFSAVVDGREVGYCCPRCWVTSLHTQRGRHERPTATDYVSQKRLPAEQCVFVEGSAVAPCCAPQMTRGKDGLPAVQCFDRCVPSVVAFASPKDALQFSKEHGGVIVSFQTLMNEKNP